MAERLFPLLYIVSNGRSGSTLLDMLLGVQDGLWSVGEVHLLPFELERNKTPCGCGQGVAQCPFWSPVVERQQALLSGGEIGRFRGRDGYGKVLRLGEIAALAGLRESSGARRIAFQRHGEDNLALLRDVRESAEEWTGSPVHFIVDASKDAYRLFWLARSGLFDLRVIHIVKNPKAFVYSKIRREDRLMAIRRTPRMALRWVVENRLIARVCEQEVGNGNVMRLRYEDLASEPERTVRDILHWLGMPSDSVTLDFRSSNHGISGNEMRGLSGGIRLDERWQREMPQSLRVLVDAISGREARRYGY